MEHRDLDKIFEQKRVWNMTNPKDIISCAYCGRSYIYLGTASGRIMQISKIGFKKNEFECHTELVTKIIVTSDESVLASVGLDGKLAIISLEEGTFDDMEYCFTYGPLSALCFGNTFSISRFSFYVGSSAGDLILFEQGWFTPKHTVIATDLGLISVLTNFKEFLAYADAEGVYIQKKNSKEAIVNVISAPKMSAEERRVIEPSIIWLSNENETQIYIAWLNEIKLVEIDSEEESVSVILSLSTDLYHCGATIFTNRLLLYCIQSQADRTRKHWIKILGKDHKKLYDQEIEDMTEEGLPNHEFRCAFGEIDSEFIVCGNYTVSLIHPITVEEKLQSFKQQQKYEECLYFRDRWVITKS